MVRSPWRRMWVCALAVSFALTCMEPRTLLAEDCDGNEFPSTFALIQKAIFENRGCTNELCHGSANMGGLDLRPGAAYDSLIDADALTVPNIKRVLAGQKDRSLLWLNLAGKVEGSGWTAPVRAMPPDPDPALTENELEVVRRWLESGAPEEGVVAGTGDLLNACLPPPEPITVRPLPPPEPGTGVQLRMPTWTLTANSEREVCFASYYDLTDEVPERYRGPGGNTFRYRFNQIRQTPLSHHLIVNLYSGATPPTSPEWGEFRCQGGERDGQPCVSTDMEFCGEGMCATDAINSIACIGFGPADAGLGIASSGFTGTQETASDFDFAPGVYREVPLKGMILWNSHAFNLTNKDGELNAWLNFEFAEPEEQLTPALQIFNTESIFKMVVPAFSTQEVCSTHVLPPNAVLYELSSHAHQRMKRWRTFEGTFTCQGGTNAGEPCSPFGPDFDSPDICAGAPCQSLVRPRSCDCNRDGEVTIDELILSAGIALGGADLDQCPDADINRDLEVSIDEIIFGVGAAQVGVPPRSPRNPEESLLYVSLIYNDPVVLRLEPPMVMARSGSTDDERSFTYCGLYDNGFTNPDEVKSRARSPQPPFPLPGFGGPCQTPTHCTAGKVGAACSGPNEARRNASCDTAEGASDGLCDACTLRGGVTTEDEMFILMGQYYVP